MGPSSGVSHHWHPETSVLTTTFIVVLSQRIPSSVVSSCSSLSTIGPALQAGIVKDVGAGEGLLLPGRCAQCHSLNQFTTLQSMMKVTKFSQQRFCSTVIAK